MKQRIFRANCLLLVVAVLLVKAAHAQSGKYLFEKVSNEQTNIHFSNEITDSLFRASSDFLYFGNGSGSGAADLNGDGKTDLFFSSNTGECKLYLNEGNFKFKDVTYDAGVKGNGKWGTGVCIADINGDGLLDIFVSHSGNFKDPESFCNEAFICTGIDANGVPHYKDMAKEMGLDLPGTRTTQVVFFDYDRDGDLDCFVLNHSNMAFGEKIVDKFFTPDTSRFIGHNMLLRNDFKNSKPHFVDVTKEAGLYSTLNNYGLGVVITDFNNDNWPDIYCTSDFANVDHLYLNNHDGTFTESIWNSFRHTSKYSMGVDAADINNDLMPDVTTADMLSENSYYLKMQMAQDNTDFFDLIVRNGLGYQFPQNMLQLNIGNDNGVPKFVDISQMAGVSNTNWSWTSLFIDFNNDGWKDLFISCGYYKDLNNQDVQNKYISHKTQNREYGPNKLNSCLFINNKTLDFKEMKLWKAEDPEMSYSACAADFDNDGKVDLLINNLNNGVSMLRNNMPATGDYINIKLKENDRNTFAIGAKVYVTSSGMTQLQEMQSVRGYESSQDYVLHFGLGNASGDVKIRIIWPDGKESETTSAPHTTITITKDEKMTKPATMAAEKKKNRFSKIENFSRDTFKHTENRFIDFKHNFTLPYKLSTNGPGVAEGDINGDGVADYYIGGATGKERCFMLGQKDGSYKKYIPPVFTGDVLYEDVAAALFDIDGDGDLDLVVVSGGVEQPDSSGFYTDRVYRNDGKGNFEKVENAFPKSNISKSCLAVGDFDNDGKPDLFIGGYTMPRKFDDIPRSFIFKNQSDKNAIKLTDVTGSVLQGSANLGMVTSASWVDMNGDHYPELVLSGEWMPCRLFTNDKGKLKGDTKATGLSELTGLYAIVYPTDYNEDGKTDIIVGNAGDNNQFHASKEKPMKLISLKDSVNKIKPGFAMSYYFKDVEAFASPRSEILDEFPQYRKYFPDFLSYATVDMKGFFEKVNLKMPEPFAQCTNLLSGVFINKGDDTYKFEAFPDLLQTSRIGAIAELDWNFDGKKDYIVSGNFLGYKHQFGMSDEMPAYILENQGGGKYRVVEPAESGLYTDGQIKKIFVTQTGDKCKLLFVRNNDKVLMYENTKK